MRLDITCLQNAMMLKCCWSLCFPHSLIRFRLFFFSCCFYLQVIFSCSLARLFFSTAHIAHTYDSSSSALLLRSQLYRCKNNIISYLSYRLVAFFSFFSETKKSSETKYSDVRYFSCHILQWHSSSQTCNSTARKHIYFNDDFDCCWFFEFLRVYMTISPLPTCTFNLSAQCTLFRFHFIGTNFSH